MPLVTVNPQGGLGGVALSGAAASGQVPVASSAAAATWKYPPGYEIGYTQITAPVNVTDTSEATATALISPGALTFDGGAVVAEFFCPEIQTPQATTATDFVAVALFEGATQITELAVCALFNLASGQPVFFPVCGRYRFTPTAGAHTYKITAFTNSTTGTPKLACGAGGTAALPPAYIRFTKV